MPLSSEISGPDSALPAGTVLQERYRIVRQLGRGGMGAVYEAEDLRLGITVALKETLSTEAGRRKQFEHEARLLAGMQHPALPRVSDHFVEGQRAFLVMQFIVGVDLARIVAQQPGPFPRDCVIAWADQLLDALIYLHSRDRQVIHRDIKPHNLKLTAGGQIFLLDFGLAKAQAPASDPSITSSQAFFGYTRHYAPLEQIQDQHTDPRSDIYALGATLYHLLTGTKPPDAMVRAAALGSGGADPLKSADKVHAAVGPQIAAILAKAMSQKPEDRYATATEFREALRRMGRVDGGVLSAPVNSEIRSGTRTIAADQRPAIAFADSAGLQMSLVGSARRFGHGAITIVLVLVLTVAGGVLYGAQGWFDASVPAALEKGTVSKVVSPPVRRNEQPRANENGSVSGKRKDVTTPIERASEKRSAPIAGKSQSVNDGRARSPERGPRQSGRRVNAPSIRLPNPDWNETGTTSSVNTPRN
ncbi:MAG: eukaryotic-like serine/threonine-protein kinase [Blastocatellia bacterium]|nr:eukaryotic-like serine/threonine-protein kinase [Blastocatellia bacterium]